MQISHVAINADAEMIDGRLSVLRHELNVYHTAGFSAVELGAHGLGVLDNGTLNEKRMKEVMAVLRDFPFQYLVHGPNPLNLMDLEQNDLERRIFGATIELTARVGSPLMVYHAGRYLPEEQFLLRGRTQLDETVRLRMRETEKLRLRELGVIAARHGVVIAVENARPYLDRPYYCYGESLQDLATMIEEVNHPNVRATLDIGHAFLSAKHYQNDLLSEIEALVPYVCHVHMHDNHGRCCASFEKKQSELAVMGRGDLHMPPGWGSIPYADVFSKFPEYRGSVTIELRPRYREYLQEVLNSTLEFLSPRERCA
ncbi:MAG: sugar phosphate isomerase/epimerase family protein [Negativicutes bacterium]